MTDWIKIKSKFANKCITCLDNIDVDEMVLWKKGEGIKHEDCKLILKDDKPLITQKEWKDFKQCKIEILRTIKNCQCCGKSLDMTKDSYFNNDRRTCESCFTV